MSEGETSDDNRARLILDALPPSARLIADRGHDSAWFRDELAAKGIAPCISSSGSRKHPFADDKVRYRRRHKVENLFARLKDRHRIATRYDHCAHTFFSAIYIATAVIFWLRSMKTEPGRGPPHVVSCMI